MRNLSLIVLIALSACFFTSQANAGSILVHDANANRADQERTINELSKNLTSSELPEATLSVLDLPFPSKDPVWIATSGQVSGCTNPARESVNVSHELARAIDLLDTMEVKPALLLLKQVATALPCQNDAINQQQLGDVFFYKGLAEFQLDDRVGAQKSFRISLAIDRGRSWDVTYPPEPQQEFLIAKEAVLDANSINLGYNFAGVKMASFYFDGAKYDPTKSGVIAVSPGLHLVHYTVGGRGYSRLIELRAGDETALVSRQGLTDAVIKGPHRNNLLAASLISLETLLNTRGFTRAYVAGGADQIYVYENGIYDSLERQLTSDGSIERPRPQPSGGVSLTVLGLAYAFGSPYATLNLKSHFKLYQGLELVVDGGVSLQAFEHFSGATAMALVPCFSVGGRYRFAKHNVMRPYVGVKAMLGFWPAESELIMFTIGVAGLGGTNIHLSKLFFLNLHLEAGYLASPWLSPQAGLGLQF